MVGRLCHFDKLRHTIIIDDGKNGGEKMRYIAVFGTQTLTQRANRALRQSSIPSEIVKIDTSLSRSGCSWGVAFDEGRLYEVKMVLSSAGVSEKEIIREVK